MQLSLEDRSPATWWHHHGDPGEERDILTEQRRRHSEDSVVEACLLKHCMATVVARTTQEQALYC
jgi:hypothetical protein